jgi:aminoglycoside phosphotransferase (APT) family kinase protein
VKTCNTVHEPLVGELVADVVGAAVDALVPVPTYPDSIVYEASAGERSVVFKACDPDGRDRDGIGLEAWAIDRAAGRRVPVPAVHAVDTSRTRFPGSYLVMERARGIPLDQLDGPVELVERLHRAVGEHLRSLHQEQLIGFGWLDEDHHRATGEVRGSTPTWRAALLGDVPAALEDLAGILDDPETERLQQAIAAIEDGFPEPAACLLHGDLGASHVFVDADAGEVTALVDFGERSAGDWLFDFAEYDGAHVAALSDGYGILSSDRDELATRLVQYQLVKAVPWAAKWHARGEHQVLDWLRRMIALADSRH